MKTRYLDASWLSLVRTPHGYGLMIFEENNDTQIPNAVLFMTGAQLAGLKRQKAIKLKKSKA